MPSDWAIAECETCFQPIRARFGSEGDIVEVKTVCAEPKPNGCPAVVARRLLAEDREKIVADLPGAD